MFVVGDFMVEGRENIKKMAIQLRQVYKRYKVGLIKEEELSSDTKRLLHKYYGVKWADDV